MNHYVVYKHTAPNGKVYIGATRNIGSRFGTGGRGYMHQPFWAAICEFGWNNIKHEILETDLTKSEAEKLEAEMIEKHDATNPEHGYNVLAHGIYCNDGCLSEAAYERICIMNRSKEHIAACVKASKSRRGIKHKAETVDAIIKTKKENGSFGKSCVCYETGEVFETMADAARAKGICPSCIYDACYKRAATAGGLHWCFAEERETFAPQVGVRPVVRRVTNVETGEVFPSGKEAAEKYGVTPSSINYALKHKNAKCAKCHWIYTDGEWRI